MFVVDTNVISELRKAPTGKADRRVVEWAKAIDANLLYLSVISILELEQGILQIERRDPSQAEPLRAWMENFLLDSFAGRIFTVDIAVARRCAALHVPNPKPERDSLIAATALVHGMTVVTRNEKDFTATGVAVLNPWKF